ncbi:CPBP family intramembrane glutamic endopeptidase [Psychroflexus aestuariivivens]|uniref:CPBP family intramembrane glutamic endopeptidase n=1 Tax=Psychroflexus aestuariivivens TaxID=1795040 RepID=UPI000FD7F19C|nr:CPBP family intramembrane glutamic endopeptidase [Psychroflexus aestuariivivens]
MQISKKALLAVSVFTLFGFSFIAYFILSFSSEFSYAQIFETDQALVSTLIGLGVGTLAGLIAIGLLELPFLKETRTFYTKMFQNIELNWSDILFYSFCAGVGEEILFRGALQPLLGLWFTAVIFVFLHGYLTVADWKKSMYGLFLILVSAAFGYLTEYFDIFAAMAAHFIYDVIMFAKLMYDGKSLKTENNESEA